MKRFAALILVVLMLAMAVIPALAYVPCRHEGCKGFLTFTYGEWEPDTVYMSFKNGVLTITEYEARTVHEKCSENCSHNCSYKQTRQVKK